MRRFISTALISATGLTSIAMLSGFTSSASATGAMHKPGWVAHPPIHIKNGATQTYQSGLQPYQIRTAYGLSTSDTGSNITIAIVDAYGSPTIQQDLHTFDQQFGLSDPTLNVVNMGTKRSNGGWALETSLDVEWAHAIAPGATIMLVEAKSASTSDLLAAIDYATSHGAQVVSNSWGGSEFSGESSYDSHFNNPGVVYTASSGDNGAGVSWPAVSPYVLGVGGTTLNTTSTGLWVSETAWSGSGGGTSAYEPVPSYQSALSLSGRGVPDVAWDADPNTGVAVYDSTSDQGQSGWFQVGGTSFGAPSWAAFVADVDQSLSATNQVYDSSELLNALYADESSSNYFHDITSGNNGTYNAGPGYDLVTGIGSPTGDALITHLVTQGGSNATVTPTSGGGSGGGGGTTTGHGNGHGKK